MKKQASKSRRVIKEDATDDKETAVSRRERLIKDKNLVRYVNKAEGSLLAIPESINVEDIFGVRYGEILICSKNPRKLILVSPAEPKHLPKIW